MNVSFFAPKKQPSPAAPASAASPSSEQTKIEVLAGSEVAAISGGPQIQNDPQR